MARGSIFEVLQYFKYTNISSCTCLKLKCVSFLAQRPLEMDLLQNANIILKHYDCSFVICEGSVRIRQSNSSLLNFIKCITY